MGVLKLIAFFAVVIAGIYTYCCLSCCHQPPLPVLDPNPWWGSSETGEDDVAIKPFNINIPDADIESLNHMLSVPPRLTPSMTNTNFTYGFHTETLTKIINYWRKEYKWKNFERKLNSFQNFKTQIEGLNIHYMRIKPKLSDPSNKVVPLLMIHGWPGSIVEFIDILPHLTTPQKDSKVVFEVICPSLPGYAFSDAAVKPGLGQLQTAQIFLKLMKRLGFEKFYIQGGDWGSVVGSFMATLYPENVLGFHSNMIAIAHYKATLKHVLGSFLPSGTFFPEEYNELKYPLSSFMGNMLKETGYMHLQATKPDTIGVALSNSPVGLAAYILEKFSTWTHKENPSKPDGRLLDKNFPISLDKMLDNICIYWFTNTITSSMRYYSELHNVFASRMDEIKTNVPTAFTAFKHDLSADPESFAALKYTNIIYHRLADGGHFPAMERPAFLAKEIHKFVSIVETKKEDKGKNEL